MVVIEQSVVYPEFWFVKLDNVTVKVTRREIDELISEARRLNKALYIK